MDSQPSSEETVLLVSLAELVAASRRGTDCSCAEPPTMAAAVPLFVLSELAVTTRGSRWWIRPDSYLRLPLDETPRPPTPSVGGRLDDGIWHGHRSVFVVEQPCCVRLRIFPVVGPAHGDGVFTSALVAVGGPG